ncbi:MAG: hypothetical protein ABIJ26_02685, partial [Candidatus Margulisiibacteriota bacterium]
MSLLVHTMIMPIASVLRLRSELRTRMGLDITYLDHRQIEWVKNWLENGQKPVDDFHEFSFSYLL